MRRRLHLYIDDSGSRRPDHQPSPRTDRMDYFALGGILIFEDEIDRLMRAHKDFMSKWELEYPLHSSRIRGHRGPFSWLRTQPDRAKSFIDALEQFLISLPVIGIACVVDRPGYVARYADRYGGQPWLMCKTAYAIMIERAVKFAQRSNAELEIFFEQSGKAEDQDIKAYTKLLKREGMPFDPDTSKAYRALTAEDFAKIILGEARERTKKTPMIQVADLYLYPMVKGGYDPTYPPYQKLLAANRLIDAILPEADRPILGIKYSCFDQKR
jgi:hypothetical protein